MVDENEGLLREVEEELRREKLANIWNKYGNLILTGLAALVIAVASWKYWQNNKIAAAQAAGMAYESAVASLANGKTDEAIKAFEVIANGDQPGYQTLAGLQLAGAYLKQGKTAEAKAAFEKIAADPEVEPLFQDFATLQAVALNIGDSDLSDVQNRLNRLVSETSPWRTNARELVALSAFHNKTYDVAKENLRAIVSDASAAAGTIQRANTLLASIAAMEVAKANPSAGATTPAEPTGEKSTATESKSDTTSQADGSPASGSSTASPSAPSDKKD